MIDTSKIVISGGPGGGKTTIINALNQLGYFCYDEISRDLIEKGIKSGKQNLMQKVVHVPSTLAASFNNFSMRCLIINENGNRQEKR